MISVISFGIHFNVEDSSINKTAMGIVFCGLFVMEDVIVIFIYAFVRLV